MASTNSVFLDLTPDQGVVIGKNQGVGALTFSQMNAATNMKKPETILARGTAHVSSHVANHRSMAQRSGLVLPRGDEFLRYKALIAGLHNCAHYRWVVDLLRIV